MASIVNGKLIDAKATEKIYPGLHKGRMNKMNAIIVHQTDSDTAQQTFNKYNERSELHRIQGSWCNSLHSLHPTRSIFYTAIASPQKNLRVMTGCH